MEPDVEGCTCLQGRARLWRDGDWRVQGSGKGSARNSRTNHPEKGTLVLGVEGQWEEGVLSSGHSTA